MPLSTDLTTFFDKNQSRVRDELFDLLRIPSVSARSEHNADTRARGRVGARTRCATIGLDREGARHEGAPDRRRRVAQRARRADGARSTATTTCSRSSRSSCGSTPPFEPTVRDGKIFARGSVDDKGQLFLHVKALEAHLATRGTLPVNVIVLAEGEEEVGSENLAEFIEAHAKRARAATRW